MTSLQLSSGPSMSGYYARTCTVSWLFRRSSRINIIISSALIVLDRPPRRSRDARVAGVPWGAPVHVAAA